MPAASAAAVTQLYAVIWMDTPAVEVSKVQPPQFTFVGGGSSCIHANCDLLLPAAGAFAQPSAIVNAANERCLGGGGVDGAIHKAAGPELRKLCEALPEVAPGVRCPTGDAVFTKACGALQSMHVIYTVGPNVSGRRYENDISDRTTDPALLPAAYERTFEVASDLGLAAVALPAVSCGVFGYPLADAARIGTRAAVASNIDHVEFVLYSDDLYDIFANAAEDACGPPLT